MLAVDGMEPMGAGLHEPFVICRPFVMTCPAQKLMKLFVDVSDAVWPELHTVFSLVPANQ